MTRNALCLVLISPIFVVAPQLWHVNDVYGHLAKMSRSLTSRFHIEAWTKWLPYCRQHSQTYFHDRTVVWLNVYFVEIWSVGPTVNKSASMYTMALNKHHGVTQTNDDQIPRRHRSSLGYNELNARCFKWHDLLSEGTEPVALHVIHT